MTAPTEREAVVATIAELEQDAATRSALLQLAATVIRATCAAPSEMSLLDINREWNRMRGAALYAIDHLKDRP